MTAQGTGVNHNLYMLLFLHIHVLIFLITFASYIKDKERRMQELRILYSITIYCEVTVFLAIEGQLLIESGKVPKIFNVSADVS